MKTPRIDVEADEFALHSNSVGILTEADHRAVDSPTGGISPADASGKLVESVDATHDSVCAYYYQPVGNERVSVEIVSVGVAFLPYVGRPVNLSGLSVDRTKNPIAWANEEQFSRNRGSVRQSSAGVDSPQNSTFRWARRICFLHRAVQGGQGKQERASEQYPQIWSFHCEPQIHLAKESIMAHSL
jgi:hypothetical protein